MNNYLEEIKETLKNPIKIIDYSINEDIRYYYSYYKNKKAPYLLVIVKYLNGEGFVVTSYFMNKIK